MLPVRFAKITSEYGKLRTLPDGKTGVHDGIDFISTSDSKLVFSICDGFVVYDFDDYCHLKRYEKPNTGGNMVIVTAVVNNKTYHIRYLHLIKNFVTKGQRVAEGTILGEYGDVGYSFGAHLHLDVYTYDWKSKVNPYEVFPFLKEGV